MFTCNEKGIRMLFPSIYKYLTKGYAAILQLIRLESE